jgi:hypothetical protein
VSQRYLNASIIVPSSDTYLVAVPTAHIDSKCDRSYVFAAADAIAKVANSQKSQKTVKPLLLSQLFHRKPVLNWKNVLLRIV